MSTLWWLLIYFTGAVGFFHVLAFLLRHDKTKLKSLGYVVLASALLAMVFYVGDIRKLTASWDEDLARTRLETYSGFVIDLISSTLKRAVRLGTDGTPNETEEQQSRRVQYLELAGELEELLAALEDTSPLDWPSASQVLPLADGEWTIITSEKQDLKEVLEYENQNVEVYLEAKSRSDDQDWEIGLLFLAPFLVATAVAAGAALVTASIKEWV